GQPEEGRGPDPRAGGHPGHPRVPGAPARRPGGDPPADRGPGGALRAPRLLPVLHSPLGLPAPKGAAPGGGRLRPPLRPGDHPQVAAELLPPVLCPAIQALLPPRWAQGGLRGPQPPWRLAYAVGRRSPAVAG